MEATGVIFPRYNGRIYSSCERRNTTEWVIQEFILPRLDSRQNQANLIMPISGNQEPRKLLSAKLDKDALMLLARDLLFVRGHKQIRITNGPGDGQRDLHSLQGGRPHVTQCKFHADSNKACTSIEVGELPLALTKLGAAHGLFLTNARLSPQAKKEMLNDYPGLSLEFVDGDTLALEVLEHQLLKQAWFDGTQISKLSNVISFPVLVRIHENDLPFSLFTSEDKLQAFRTRMKDVFPEFAVSITNGTRTVEDFRPYRPPSFPTSEEGASPWIGTIEVLLQGDIGVADAERAARAISESVARVAYDNARITVVVGRPTLATVTAPTIGLPISIEPNVANFLLTTNVCTTESEFFRADALPVLWTTDHDARVSESQWIRLYSPQIDCALSYEMTHSSVTETDPDRIFSTATRRFGWQYSVHALLPGWEGNWPYLEIRAPDETIAWHSGTIICSWSHHLLQGTGMLRIPAWNFPVHPLALPASEKSSEEVREIESKLESLPEAQILEPEKARHMIAAVGADVYGETFKWTYDTGIMLHYLADTRRPLFPRRRVYAATFVWSVDTAVEEELEIDSGEAESEVVAIAPEISYDSGYIIAQIDVVPKRVQDDSTTVILLAAHECLLQWATGFEVILMKRYQNVKRCTAQFWKERHNVALGVNLSASTKKFVGATPAEVGLEYLADRLPDVW